MAKAATKRKPRASRRVTGMAAMPTKTFNQAKHYVHYEVESREWVSTIKSYIKKNLKKADQTAINKLPDWKLNGSHWATVAYLLSEKETLVTDYWKSSFHTFLEKLVEEGKKIVAEKKAEDNKKKNVYVPNIQERLMEAAEEKTGELDEWIDDFLRDPKKNSLKNKMPLESFRKNEINLGHTRWITKWFQGALEELEELVNLPKSKLTEMEKQLQEGYNHLTKSQQKELYEFHKRIFQAMEIIRAEKKQSRTPRKTKAKSASEIVKKMKFNPSDSKYGIASVNPADVVGATAIVIFNTKNRKIGVYHAEEHQTISVKGTTLIYFDTVKSVQKTVRKPEEVLPNWKKVTKHKLKTLFGYLKTTETKLNGRMNEDTIILKVFK